MDYTIVYGHGTSLFLAKSQLEKEVRKMIAMGYKPQGGITAVPFFPGNSIEVCQAVIRTSTTTKT